MVKLLLSLFVCVVLPAVVLCRPQISQNQPQVQPPISGDQNGPSVFPPKPQVQPPISGPSILPANPDTSIDVVAPNAAPAIGNHVQPAAPVIGNHVQPGVVVEDFAAKTETSTGNSDASPSVLGSSVHGCPRFYKPVCGSNNKTYNTECELRMAQINDSTLTKSAEGACNDKSS